MNILDPWRLQKAMANGSLVLWQRYNRTKYVGPTVVAFRFRFPVPRHGITHPPKPHPSKFPIFLCIHRMINKREVLDVLSHSLTVSLISKHVDISIKKNIQNDIKKSTKSSAGATPHQRHIFIHFYPMRRSVALHFNCFWFRICDVAAPADESGNWARLNGLFKLAKNQKYI